MAAVLLIWCENDTFISGPPESLLAQCSHEKDIRQPHIEKHYTNVILIHPTPNGSGVCFPYIYIEQ